MGTRSRVKKKIHVENVPGFTWDAFPFFFDALALLASAL
jgi:hypothetical protein